MAAQTDQVPEAALAWAREGAAALATVVETWSSAPRPAGAQLAISGRGETLGSISGGCVEGAVAAEALAALADGRPRLLELGVPDAQAFAAGLACGGGIRVLVEPIGRGDGPGIDLVAALAAARAARRPAVYAVRPGRWERRIVLGPEDPLWPEAEAALAADRSGFVGDWFLGVQNPPLRMAIIGAGRIAEALAPMARIAGFEVTILDPREGFAVPARFPGFALVQDRPEAGLTAFAPDSRSAVVALSHVQDVDDPAIRAALDTPAFYLGCLGSSRNHAKRAARLAEAGVPPEAIARIHGPIGLDIGARSPAEIAVAILAEAVARLRRPGARR